MKSINYYIMTMMIGISTAATIKGTISDSDNKDPLIGASVLILETTIGANTDIDGFYTIQNIPEGNYQLKITYIGYEPFISDSIFLESDSYLTYDQSLTAKPLEAMSVQVEALLDKNDGSDIISEKKKSKTIQDAVSSEDISKTGDSNVADAVKRISGVSITDGKFAVVRGLSSRYTNTVLNSSPVPSPEADKKIIPLDLIPTSVIASVSAHKTYTPNMPGMFAGGSIDIKTKAYPDNKVFNFKISMGDKIAKEGSSYLLQHRSFMDFIGYDDNRKLPANIPSDKVIHKATIYRPIGLTTIQWYGMLGEYGRQLENKYRPRSGSPVKPISLGMDIGNKYDFQAFEFGYFSNLTFSNTYTNRSITNTQYSLSDNIVNEYSKMDNSRSSYNTNLGLNFSSGIKYLDNHHIQYKFLYSHVSSDEANQSVGFTPNIQPGLFLRSSYEEKLIQNHHLSGKHEFYGLINSKIEWSSSNGISSIFDPDTRSHNYEIIDIENEDGTVSSAYYIDRQAQKIGYRDFADGFDNNSNTDFDISMNFNLFGISTSSNFGYRNQIKDRTFERRSLSITNSSSSSWNDSVLYTYSLDDIGQAFDNENYFALDDSTGEWSHGLILQDETANNAFNGYEAKEDIEAFYLMFNSTLLNNYAYVVELMAGSRFEKYQLNLNSYNPITGDPSVTVYGDTTIVNNIYDDVFPALTFSVLHNDNKKILLSYSKTVNRPQFREMAPIAYQEFYAGEVAIGFPFLEPSYIKNYDFRFEWYLSKFELFSIGLFSKTFDNPIETSFISTPDLTYETFQNAKNAKTSGIEIEFRKRLPIIPIHIGGISLFSNLTISDSEVEVDTLVTLFNGTQYGNDVQETKRKLQGHSNVLFNITLDGKFNNGYNASLSYNTFSKRISSIGSGLTGDEYEYPFHLVNITAAKKFNNNLKVSLKIKNLLNSKVRFGIEDENNERYYKNIYEPGYSYSIGLSYSI